MDITRETYKTFSRLPKTQTTEFNSQLHPQYNAEHFALSMTGGSLLLALNRAREARELALSYRDFRVGAAIVALTANGPARFQMLTGINIKPDKDSELNGHAEQMALQMADDRQFTAISMVAVVGETQADQQSGHDMCTLHPCGLCRGVMASHPLVDAKNTLIFSALPTLRTIEVSTIEGLQAFHDNDTPDTSDITRFDFPDMELLKPYDNPNNEPIRLIDDDATRAEEELWDTTIGWHLLQHRMKLLSDLARIN